MAPCNRISFFIWHTQNNNLTCLKWCLEISKRSPSTDVNVSSYSSLTYHVETITCIQLVILIVWYYQFKSGFKIIIFWLLNYQKVIFTFLSNLSKATYLLRPQVILAGLNENRITPSHSESCWFILIKRSWRGRTISISLQTFIKCTQLCTKPFVHSLSCANFCCFVQNCTLTMEWFANFDTVMVPNIHFDHQLWTRWLWFFLLAYFMVFVYHNNL